MHPLASVIILRLCRKSHLEVNFTASEVGKTRLFLFNWRSSFFKPTAGSTTSSKVWQGSVLALNGEKIHNSTTGIWIILIQGKKQILGNNNAGMNWITVNFQLSSGITRFVLNFSLTSSSWSNTIILSQAEPISLGINLSQGQNRNYNLL